MSRKTLRLASLTLGLAILAACQGRCGRPRPSQHGPDLADSADPSFSAEPVSYCGEISGASQPTRIQFLVDASGSMNGFSASMPTLTTWVEHTISGLRGSSLDLTSLETCQFNQRNGLFNCHSTVTLPDYTPTSDTNLHEAIRKARTADLTFIVTDGVAATGVGGAADCATGVDAACVARALREAVLPGAVDEAGVEGEGGAPSGGGADPGIWILPLVATFDGRLYTEEAISLQDFEPAGTIAEIQAQLERETFVRDSKLGRDGKLNFYYRGPKVLLLIVISRQQKLGRDAVLSFWNQASLSGVSRLEGIKDYARGFGSLPAIEVYPGYLHRIQFKSLQPTDEPSEHRGTLDIAFEPKDGRSSLRLDCPLNGSGEGVFILEGERRDRSQSATCVPIQQLPAYSLRLEPSRERTDKADLDTLIRGYQREKGGEVLRENGEALRLDLACGAGPRRPCGENPLPVQWNALRDYGRTAAGLAAPDSGGIALSSVLAISTAHPSREPHRVFGMGATLQYFYELVQQDARRLTLSEFEVCNGPSQ